MSVIWLDQQSYIELSRYNTLVFSFSLCISARSKRPLFFKRHSMFKQSNLIHFRLRVYLKDTELPWYDHISAPEYSKKISYFKYLRLYSFQQLNNSTWHVIVDILTLFSFRIRLFDCAPILPHCSSRYRLFGCYLAAEL